MEETREVSRDLALQSRKISRKKQLILVVVLLVAALLLAGTIFISVKINGENRIEKIRNNAQNWKETAIVLPQTGSLQPAGYVTIQWKSAKKMGDVLEYKIYVDGKQIAKTDGNTTTCEYHVVDVSRHLVFVEADLKYGSKIYSDISPFYVNKKGFCMNKQMAQNVNAEEWGVSWYYNWSLYKHNYTSFRNLQFVPMMWTTAPTDAKEVEILPKLGYKYLLTFNEPDLEEQSNLSVDNAVKGMKAFRDKGLLVGSPATALLPPWSKEWFQPFMEQMKENKMDVDFIPVHHYWNWYNEEGVQAFLDLIDETWEMYHKPIWITEFAISGDPGRDEQQRQSVIGYMKGVIPEHVERYAWFSFSPTDYKNGGSALLNHYTGKITQLGYLYQKLGMPDGYDKNKTDVRELNSEKDIIQ